MTHDPTCDLSSGAAGFCSCVRDLVAPCPVCLKTHEMPKCVETGTPADSSGTCPTRCNHADGDCETARVSRNFIRLIAAERNLAEVALREAAAAFVAKDEERLRRILCDQNARSHAWTLAHAEVARLPDDAWERIRRVMLTIGRRQRDGWNEMQIAGQLADEVVSALRDSPAPEPAEPANREDLALDAIIAATLGSKVAQHALAEAGAPMPEPTDTDTLRFLRGETLMCKWALCTSPAGAPVTAMAFGECECPCHAAFDPCTTEPKPTASPVRLDDHLSEEPR